MNYKTIDFFSQKEIEIINIIKDNINPRYWILSKVRLSEFLYSTKEYGSSEFYTDFKKINQITLPCIIFDTHKNIISAVIFFDSDPDSERVLIENGISSITLSEVKLALMHTELLKFYQ